MVLQQYIYSSRCIKQYIYIQFAGSRGQLNITYPLQTRLYSNYRKLIWAVMISTHYHPQKATKYNLGLYMYISIRCVTVVNYGCLWTWKAEVN